MSRSLPARTRAFLVVALLGAGCLDGGTDRPGGRACSRDEDCAEALVCRYGRCRSTCFFDRDCPPGRTCVAGPGGEGQRVCTVEGEGEAEPCPGDGVLADGCRDGCEVPDDCLPGYDCVGSGCVEQPGWHDLTPATGPGPGPIFDSRMVDSPGPGTLLFGGATVDESGESHVAATWRWDGRRWTDLSGLGLETPAGREDHAMAFDSIRQVVVLHGGQGDGGTLGDTWEWRAETGWEQVETSPSPGRRQDHAMTFDSVRGVTVLFGGEDRSGAHLDDTWEWDGESWTEVGDGLRPPPRGDHAMAFDGTRTVLCGGAGLATGDLEDCWVRTGTDWSELARPEGMPASSDTMMACSPAGRCLLLLDSLWEWNGAGWDLVDEPWPGSGRDDPNFAFDLARGVFVLQGGGLDLLAFEDVWELWP